MSLPSTPSRISTRQKSTKSSASRRIDLGKPPGVYDNNSVRDRIRQWQAQGGGVIEAEDIEPEDSDYKKRAPKVKIIEKESSPVTPCSRHEKRGGIEGPAQSVASDADRNSDLGNSKRPGSAPAKRVVSDGHWRKPKSPPKSSSTSRIGKDIDPSWTKTDTRIRVDSTLERRQARTEGGQAGKKSPEAECLTAEVPSVTPVGSRRKSERPLRRRSVSPRDSIAEEGTSVREYASPMGHHGSKRKSSASGTSLHAGSSAAKDISRRHRRSSQRSEGNLDSIERSARERGSMRSEKGNILSQVFGDSRKLFAKHSPEPAVTPRVPSIEAWLKNTSDPFVDAEEPSIPEIPPLKIARRKSRPSEQGEVPEDPNRIWDRLDTKEGTRRAISSNTKKRRVPSSAIYSDNPFPVDFDSDCGLSGGTDSKTASKFVDLAQGLAETSSPSLKRRAARKSVSSPLRDRPNPLTTNISTEYHDVKSDHSSQLTSSSVEGPNPSLPFRPPILSTKRHSPSTGQHRLSTIASVETFNTRAKDAVEPSVCATFKTAPKIDPIIDDFTPGDDNIHIDGASFSNTNSHLTKHADLISVLSLPRASSKSIRSARSIRTNRTRLEAATMEDLMQELSTDEGKYMRELVTLVDGVIPVLLSCVLSKSDAATAAGLFQPSVAARQDPNFTRPIIDMGIALERLRTLHKRIPQRDSNAFLTWAHGAQRVYVEYLRAWRMGFQDVVVNLAPAVTNASTGPSEPKLDEGLPRDEHGDVINGDGEKVDVAFLLRRPLVRLKYLAKSLKGINIVKPSAEATNLAMIYQGLVEAARLRANEEKARLEDEAAANIDATRCRDPRTLAPLSGVIVDRTRRVRARDHFNLALQHSSGQCVDCRVELLLRDEAADSAKGGDLLICEVDTSGRWLLFPPIKSDLVSARNGDKKGEMVIMIRGFGSDVVQWQEILSLGTEEEQVGFEWVQMLGLQPVPPSIGRSQSFVGRECSRKKAQEHISSDQFMSGALTSPSKDRTPSPREIDVPIGEQASQDSKRWSHSPIPPHVQSSRRDGRLGDIGESIDGASTRVSTNYIDKVNDLRSLPSQNREKELISSESLSCAPRSFKEALGLSGSSAMSGLRRTKAKRISKQLASSPTSSRSRSSRHDSNSHMSSPENIHVNDKQGKMPPRTDSVESTSSKARAQPLMNHRSLSPGPELQIPSQVGASIKASIPSMDLPHIPKVRRASPPVTPSMDTPKEPIWSTPPEGKPALSPSELTEECRSPNKKNSRSHSSAPSAPAHKRSSTGQTDLSKPPGLEQTRPGNRRSSSPLKHEYEPSTASESPTDSDASTVEHHEVGSMTESSDEEDLEDGDVPTPLLPLGAIKRVAKLPTRPSSLSTPEGTLKPSDSASQAPYKTVPVQPSKAAKTIALIFTWSDAGSWQSLHPDECSIVITPGLIEAFEMSAAHSNSKPLSASAPIIDHEKFADDASTMTSQNNEVQGERPLVALELTPLVPLRRGTALDISIRSPPTANSQVTSGNNIMFRSRNPEECEALYALINHSRIHNPTYIALQNARGPFASGSSYPGAIGRRPNSKATNARNSWFGGFGRSTSYRASSARTPSIAPSESSVGSMSSAFSALKRFGRAGGGGMFNIALSTITSRDGAASGANSVCASSDNSSGSGAATPIAPGMIANRDGSLGLKDAKIRLYIRETASRWRDMGSARLTIIQPERAIPGSDGRSINFSGHPHSTHEKRILVNGKTKGEVLLDAQLGENCFERVARTGIAVSVWEDVVGPNGEVGVVGAVGGVAGGRAKVYMIQVCGVATYPSDEVAANRLRCR